MEAFDVVIVGAGPAGSACAIALARAGVRRVALVHAGDAVAITVGETIPPDARLLLDRLGLLEAFLAEGHARSLGSCSAWGSDTLGYNDFLLNPQGSGWHLDRARFDAFLRSRTMDAGATLIEGARLDDAVATGNGYRLRFGGREIEAGYVVDASGRGSAFARRVGARQLLLDRLTFVYGFFETTLSASRSRLTLLEAVPEGWWYAAALPGDRVAVAFAGDADGVRADGLGQEARWLEAVSATHHLAERLDGCRFISGSLTPRVAPSFRLDPVCGPHWLAIGDAAACFDPLAAQGIYKALEDGIDAAAVITGGSADDYVAIRGHFYALEQRWPESPFWQRRQARAALAA